MTKRTRITGITLGLVGFAVTVSQTGPDSFNAHAGAIMLAIFGALALVVGCAVAEGK